MIKKIGFRKWSFVKKISAILFGGVSVLWLTGIFIQFIHSIIRQDYSMFYEYGQIALTVFGFTLIGGIFENKKKQPLRIVKNLFDSSLSFLITAISFFFMYSLSSIFTKEMTPMGDVQTYLLVGSFSLAMLIGFCGLIVGLLNLYILLVNYRIEFDE